MNFLANSGRGMLVRFLTLAALLTVGDAMAQFGGGFPGGSGFPGSGGMRANRGGGDRSASKDRQRPSPVESRVNSLEQSIEELRVDLKLQQEQISAWEVYTGKLRALAGDIAKSRDQMPPGPETSVLQRVDRSVDAARNRLAATEDVADAAKVLYEMLAPEQRAAANPRLATIINNAQAETPRMTGLK